MSVLAAHFGCGKGGLGRHDLSRMLVAMRPGQRSNPDVAIFEDGGIAVSQKAFTREDGFDPGVIVGGAGRFHLVFDGRLDYREELAARLAIPALEVAKHSDAWLAMRAWEKFGEAAPENMEGDYALILWDTSEHRLFAARDHLGQCPLSFVWKDGAIAVASSPAGIFASRILSPEVDLERLSLVLARRPGPATRSVFRGVLRLPAGHVLTADRGGFRLRRYWSLKDDLGVIRLKSDDDYAEQASALLDAAVKTRLRTIDRVACDLSGGLDSSTVAITALKFLQNQKTLPTCTHVPEPGWDGRVVRFRYADETPYVRQIQAMHPAIDPTFFTYPPTGSSSVLNDYFASVGSVWSLPRYIAMRAASFSAAKSKGASVMLNGGAGNLSLSWSGESVFGELLRDRRWGALAAEILATGGSPVGALRTLVSRVLVPSGPEWLWRLYAHLRFGPSDTRSWSARLFVNPDLAASLPPLPEFRAKPLPDDRDLRAELLAPEDNHEAAEFHAAARSLFDVDYRDPLRDRRLVAWCLSIPEGQYWRNGTSRWLIRRVIGDRLPRAMLDNKLRGHPEADWHFQMTKELPAMREQLEVLASDPDVAGLLDIEGMRRTLNAWPSETPSDADDPRQFLLPASLPHALAVGRFVRWAKGANL